MNKTIKEFGKICKMNQSVLKIFLYNKLRKTGYDVINGDGFLYAKGEIPILLTAHMDTVHEITCRRCFITEVDKKEVISSLDGIGGDDRCGIWIILDIIGKGYKPSILFCEDEEIGGVGSNKFCKTKYIEDLKEMNYLIEIDRANSDDAVFYNCGNEDFKKFILDNTGYKEAFGTFSDISHLSPACDVASVNLSCGYYNPHTTKEYVVISEMEKTSSIVEKLLNTESEKFDYQEFRYYGGCFGLGEELFEGIEIIYPNEEGEYVSDIYWGDTEEYCLGLFFIEHPTLCLNDIQDYEPIYW